MRYATGIHIDELIVHILDHLGEGDYVEPG